MCTRPSSPPNIWAAISRARPIAARASPPRPPGPGPAPPNPPRPPAPPLPRCAAAALSAFSMALSFAFPNFLISPGVIVRSFSSRSSSFKTVPRKFSSYFSRNSASCLHRRRFCATSNMFLLPYTVGGCPPTRLLAVPLAFKEAAPSGHVPTCACASRPQSA